MDNRVIHSPIPPSTTRKLLDVGCGTGIISDLLGNTFPSAKVFGIDLSPVPEHIRQHPTNVKFVQGNVLDGADSLNRLTGGGELFDLIFSRYLVFGFNNWHDFLSVCHSALAPGGYIESQEFEIAWYDDAGVKVSEDWEWWKRLRSEMTKRGMDPDAGTKMKKWMENAGFVDVQHHEYKWTFNGEYEKDEKLRDMAMWTVSEGGHPPMFAQALNRLVTASDGEGDAVKEEVKRLQQEIKDTVWNQARWEGRGLYAKVHVVTGRKAE
jgi:trans-aconitate methyltransferase